MINSGYSVAFHVEGGLVNLGEFPRIRKCKRSALSSLAGMNLAGVKQAKYLGELTGLGKKKKGIGSKYLFKNKLLHKAFFYGLQSYASGFAYMDREKFEKRGWYNHFFSFSIGVFNGFIQADTYAGFWHSLIGYSLFDYGLKTINNGYDPYNYKDREIKAGIFSLKSIPLLF